MLTPWQNLPSAMSCTSVTGGKCAKQQWQIYGMPTVEQEATMLRVHTSILQIVSVFEEPLLSLSELQIVSVASLTSLVWNQVNIQGGKHLARMQSCRDHFSRS